MSRPREAASRPLGARLFVALQYLLPQHLLSRTVHALARVRYPPLKNLLIRGFMRGYRPDLSEALESDPLRYPTFNALFTRGLRPGAREVPAELPRSILAPVDGAVSAAGHIVEGQLLQAKGLHYRLETLLAGRAEWAARFRDGHFATLYLAPPDYHRVHLPRAGTLIEACYVPGRLFSVNRATAAAVPGLFTRNERLILGFQDCDSHPFAVILVGALNVGSMATVWHGEFVPRAPRRPIDLPLETARSALRLPAGAEIGRFNLGSTVILLFAAGPLRWRGDLTPGRSVRMGEPIGEFLGADPATAGETGGAR